jgi:hypothetical protein
MIDMDSELIDSIGTERPWLNDIDGTIKKLHDRGFYAIARIVCMRDGAIADTRPDLLLRTLDGAVYKDNNGITWMNPFKQGVLDYLVEVARGCAKVGFDEVKFDYIRFPTDKIVTIDIEAPEEELTKIDAITNAVKYLCEHIKPMGMYVSADVFGGVITSAPDQRNVGQLYHELCKYLDYICPMVYPSHYSKNYYNIPNPNSEPYKLVYRAMQDSVKVTAYLDEYAKKAEVRPWLQDFSMGYTYGKKEVRDQIEATYDAGYTSWMLWNAGMTYTESALMTKADADYAYAHRPDPTPIPTPTLPPNATPTPRPKTGEYFEKPWGRE